MPAETPTRRGQRPLLEVPAPGRGGWLNPSNVESVFAMLGETKATAEEALQVQAECLEVLKQIRDRLPPPPVPPGASE